MNASCARPSYPIGAPGRGLTVRRVADGSGVAVDDVVLQRIESTGSEMDLVVQSGCIPERSSPISALPSPTVPVVVVVR